MFLHPQIGSQGAEKKQIKDVKYYFFSWLHRWRDSWNTEYFFMDVKIVLFRFVGDENERDGADAKDSEPKNQISVEVAGRLERWIHESYRVCVFIIILHYDAVSPVTVAGEHSLLDCFLF